MLSTDLVDNELTMLWIELGEIESPACANVSMTSSGALVEWHQENPPALARGNYFIV